MFDDGKCKSYIMSSKNFGKRHFLTQYTSAIQDTEAPSENVKGFGNNFLETEINDESCMLLRGEESSPRNPALVMDLGHYVVKAEKQLEHCYSNTDVAEVKRLILQEETVLPTGNELIAVTEINPFKKELQLNRRKVLNQIKGSQLKAYSRNRLNESKIIPLTNTENVLSSSSDMSNNELFPSMNTGSKEYEISHNRIVDFLIVNNSPNSAKTKVLTNTDMITNDGRMTGITTEITENSMKSQSNDKIVYTKKDLMCLVWKKWKRFTLDKKLSMKEYHTFGTKNDTSKNMQTHINRKVMRKFWDIWLQMVRDKKGALSVDHGKLQMERTDKFLKELQERKQSLIAITAATMTRDLNNVKRGNKNNSKYSYHNFQPKNKRCNKQNIQDNTGVHTRIFPSNLNNEYQYMFEVQQNIIAEQKSKLQEQSKLIKELQLTHLRLQTEKSTKEAQEDINKMLSSCELRLKPKAKQMKNRLSTVHRRSEFPEKDPIVTSLKTVPTIVNRMEERAQERETRWRLIKERKQKLIEERDKRKREEEEERKQKEECEKRQKIVELKEKRRLEKQMEIRKKKEREIMHNLLIKASLQYKELLMKKVICSLKRLVTHKWMLTDIAEKHYKTQLLCNSFQIWRTHVQSIINFKMYKVTALYNRILMKKVFRGLFQVYAEYIIKNQVAADFYDIRLQEHVFVGWHHAASTEHVVTINKQEKATVHYNRKLLTQYLKRWQQLPSVLQLEHEKEQRKQIWRKKVQEILPDFRPGLTMLEDSDLMS